jgi:DNA modification methylase
MQNALKIHEVRIDDLNPSPYNPRTWSKEATKQLKESIQRFGLVDPILVNKAPGRDNIVIGGHFRLKVTKDLGYETVPVVFVNIPDVGKEKELNLRMNRNQGDWDYDMLRNFDMDLLCDIGFDDSDLQHIWDDFVEVEDDNFNLKDEMKKLKEAFVKEGEIYALGEHRLVCGDSTDPETLKKLLKDKKVGFVTLDPPYNIGLSYSDGIGTRGKYGGTKTDDNKPTAIYKAFLKTCLENALAHSEPDAHVFCWNDQKHIGLVQSIFEEIGIKNKRVCLWLKNAHSCTPQVAFNKMYEPCMYGTRGDPFLSNYHTAFNEVFNKEVGTGNRLHGDILDLFDIWLEKRVPANLYIHPTQKPPSLYERAIRRCTKPGDNILELFGGSGSTLIAADQLKRTCFLVELDPLFASLIIIRYEQHTGQKAQKIN